MNGLIPIAPTLQASEERVKAGPLDILIIYFNEETQTYHPVFYQEMPSMGKDLPFNEVKLVRLTSKAHHTTGADTLEEARELLQEMRDKYVDINDQNVFSEWAPLWDGHVGDVLFLANWRKTGIEVPLSRVLPEVI